MSDTAILDAPADTMPTNAPGNMLDGGVSSDGYSSTTAAEMDWGHLNSEPNTSDFDSNETIEQAMTRNAAKQDAAAKPVDAPVVEEKAAAPAGDTIEQKAEIWDRFDKTFQENPQTIANLAVKAMSPEQKTAFLKSLGAEPAAAAAPAAELPDISPDYEAASDLEDAIMSRWEDIKSLPEMRKQMAELQAGMGEQMSAKVRELHEPIGISVAHGEIALAKLDALCEAFGIDLPTPDMAAISEKLKDGRTTMRSAISALTAESFKKSVAEHRQGRAARPQTPGNQSTREPKLPVGASMLECARALGIPGM
jgi:hypothetical protein